MTYKPTKWVNTVYDDEGNILRKGTPLMAENMNNIEGELVRLSQKESETDEVLGNHEDRITNSEQKIEGIEGRLDATENKVNELEISKGRINGIATLDENGIVPSTQLPSNLKEIKVVPTLTDRDNLEKFEGLRVMVLDASADDTVNSGWAEYVWNGTEFIKVAEAEGIDLAIKWADVENKPTEFNPKKHSHTESEISDLDKYTKQEVDTKLSGKANTIHRHSASEIDGLYVTHEHNNKEVLDKITQDTLDKIDSNEQKIENLEESNHTHSNKGTLDKLVYSGGKSSVDLIALEELERHTHDALHTHSNKQVIDKFTEVDGQLLYNNEEIGGAVPNLTLTELTLGGRFKIVYNDIEDSLDIEVIA
jgi:hypothetical protein